MPRGLNALDDTHRRRGDTETRGTSLRVSLGPRRGIGAAISRRLNLHRLVVEVVLDPFQKLWRDIIKVGAFWRNRLSALLRFSTVPPVTLPSEDPRTSTASTAAGSALSSSPPHIEQTLTMRVERCSR